MQSAILIRTVLFDCLIFCNYKLLQIDLYDSLPHGHYALDRINSWIDSIAEVINMSVFARMST